MTNLAIAEKLSKEFNLRIAPQTLSCSLKDAPKDINIEEPDDYNIIIRVEIEECFSNDTNFKNGVSKPYKELFY